MVVPPAKKSPIAIIDPSLGLNNMVTLQPGKTWVWLGDFFPYVSAIDSVTVPKNHPGAGISNLRYAWNRGAGDSLRGKGSVCDLGGQHLGGTRQPSVCVCGELCR